MRLVLDKHRRRPIILRIHLGTPRVLAGILLAVLAVKVAADTLTMTTNYPSPVGVYKRMITTARTILARDSDRVGIGTTDPAETLDVNGIARAHGVKLGDGGACTAAGEGKIAYRGGRLQLCDGSHWVAIGGGFGERQFLSPDVWYTAPTDGLITAWGAGVYFYVQIADRTYGYFETQTYASNGSGITFAVKKDEPWRVLNAGGWYGPPNVMYVPLQ